MYNKNKKIDSRIWSEEKYRVRRIYLCDLVECCVASKWELRPRHVVADGGRNDHHGDTELGVRLPVLDQLQSSLVCLKQRKQPWCPTSPTSLTRTYTNTVQSPTESRIDHELIHTQWENMIKFVRLPPLEWQVLLKWLTFTGFFTLIP